MMAAGYHGGLTDQPGGMWHKPKRKHLVRLIQKQHEEILALKVRCFEVEEERDRALRGLRKLKEGT